MHTISGADNPKALCKQGICKVIVSSMLLYIERKENHHNRQDSRALASWKYEKILYYTICYLRAVRY